METRNLTCIGCPLGCSLSVQIENEQVVSVSGNTCPRGDAYARKEVTNPTRIVTSTVRVAGAYGGMVSCKTQEDIPKNMIFDVVNALKDVEVNPPVRIGDVLVENVAGTGVNVVATKNMKIAH
ncbi:MAG: DUF1667 domain-containing protein [Agathobacter sp.]|nr:DUF1667 domain-containing protein [Agathobacter sp.]